MEKQLSFGLESFSAGTLKNRASWKKHLSSKKERKPKQENQETQPVNKLLLKEEKELKIKSLSLKGAGTERNPLGKTLPNGHSSKEELLFLNRINKLLSTKEASGILGVSENALRILVCRKKIKAHKLGSRLKFKFSDLMNCLQKKEV